MRQNKSPLRGSVTQNNVSVRMRAQQDSGMRFLTRLGLLAGGILLLIGALIWVWHSGWLQNKEHQAQEAGLTLTQKAQFSVKDIVVEGRHQSSKDEISDALGTQRGAPILAFDPQSAASRLSKLPWIENAVVERRLPDTVAVILTERIPAVRWQHDDHFYLLDTQGLAITSAKIENFTDLPLVVGTGGDSAASALLALLNPYPDIQARMDSAVRVGERRWDLHLHPSITIRLPEKEPDSALHRLSVLITQEKILDRNIVAIDLRLTDRLMIEPAPAAHPAGGTPK